MGVNQGTRIEFETEFDLLSPDCKVPKTAWYRTWEDILLYGFEWFCDGLASTSSQYDCN
jgi:hypothetical protein